MPATGYRRTTERSVAASLDSADDGTMSLSVKQVCSASRAIPATLFCPFTSRPNAEKTPQLEKPQSYCPD